MNVLFGDYLALTCASWVSSGDHCTYNFHMVQGYPRVFATREPLLLLPMTSTTPKPLLPTIFPTQKCFLPTTFCYIRVLVTPKQKASWQLRSCTLFLQVTSLQSCKVCHYTFASSITTPLQVDFRFVAVPKGHQTCTQRSRQAKY